MIEEKMQTTKDLIDQLGNTDLDAQNMKSKKLLALTLAMTQDIKTPRQSPQKVKVLNLNDKPDPSSISDDNEEGAYSINDEELLEKAKKKLGFFAKTLIYFKK